MMTSPRHFHLHHCAAAQNLLPSTSRHVLGVLALFLVSLLCLADVKAADLYVGSNSYSQTTNFTSGTNSYGSTYVGYNSGDLNNLLTVEGPGTLLTNTGSFFVGYQGASNTMVVSNGGTVVADVTSAVGSQSSFNQLVVDGSNSKVTITGGLLDVGFGSTSAANSNSLVITNGGSVYLGKVQGGSSIGAFNAQGNSVLVTGAGASLTNKGIFYVGFRGASNSLTIEDGGAFMSDNLMIGDNTNGVLRASNNSVLVTGGSSTMTVNTNLYVGGQGKNNSLLISEGAGVVAGSVYLGANTYANGNNSVTITGSNSSLRISSLYLRIGNYENGDTVTVSDGARLTGYSDSIGYYGNGNTLLVTGAGSRYSSTYLNVGDRGANNSLVISNGGSVAISGGPTLVGRSAGSNSVMITGAVSAFSNAVGFYLGSYAANGNSITVSDGASLRGMSDIIGFYGSGNRLLVTGSNSLYSNTSTLNIGYSYNSYYGYSTNNSLVISNGGTAVVNGRTYLGNGSAGATNVGSTNNNTVQVTGSNSTFRSSSGIYIGTYEDSDTITVTDGAKLYGNKDYVGFYGNNNMLTIESSSSRYTNSGDLYVGYYGSGNSVMINGGARASVVSGTTYIGAESVSSNNTVTVTGNGSFFTNSGDLIIGLRSSGNSLLLSNGGSASVAGATYIGSGYGSTSNSLTVTGTNSLFRSTGLLLLGDHASGNTMLASNGAVAVVAAAIATGTNFVGNDGNGNSLVITGSGTAWTNGGEALTIGRYSKSNSLVVSNGAQAVNYAGMTVGISPGYAGNNTVIVTGNGSMLSNSGGFVIGSTDNGNVITVSGGAELYGNNDTVGSYSSGNTLTVTGTDSLYSNSGTLDLGYRSGGNTMLVSNGAIAVVSGKTSLGYSGGGNNAVLVSGGNSTFKAAGGFVIGNFGNGDLITVSDGATLYGFDDRIGNKGSGNTLTVSGPGSLYSNSGTLYIGYNAFGSYPIGNNSLIISNGAVAVVNGTTYLGNANYFQGANDNNNSIVVTGSNSVFRAVGGFVIGQDENSDSITVKDGASLYGRNDKIGSYWSSNSLAVSGSGSRYSNSGNLDVGFGGTGNTMLLSNGAVSTIAGTVTVGNGASNNTMTLSQSTLSASSVAVMTNNLLTGNGTLTTTAGTTIQGGTFSPTGTNALTVNGNLGFTNCGTYLWSLFANSTNNPSSGTNYTVPVQLNGNLSVSTDSVMALKFSGGVNAGDSFWDTNRQWQVIAGTNSLSSGMNFNLAWSSPDASQGLDINYFGLSSSNNSLYLNYYIPVVTNIVIAPGTNNLPTFNGPPTELVIEGPTNGTAVLAASNPKLISIVLNSGSLSSTNPNSIPSNSSVTVYDGAMGFTGPGTNSIGSLFVGGGQVAASNTIVNVQSYVQTGGAITGGTNATYWAANYYFAATNDATVNANLANLGTVTNFHSTAIVTTNESGAPVAPVVFENSMTYDGGTVITGGILQLGSSNSTGAVSVQGVITNNGVLNYGYNGNSTTPTNEVTGSGVIGQIGTGTLIVGSVGVDTNFTGSFAAANGTLAITTNSALGNATNFYLSSGGTLQATAGITNITDTIQVTNGIGVIDNASGGTLSLNGTLSKSGTVLVLAGGSFNVNAQITGSGAPGSFDSDIILGSTTLGAATVTLNGSNNNYVGPTYVTSGSELINGTSNALPTDTVLNMGTNTDSAGQTNRYDMAGYSQAIAGLSSVTNLPSANVVTNSGAAVMLTVNGATNTTYAGIISGDIALIRSGTGVITLTQNNTYTGGTTINSGKIVTAANTALGTGPVTLNAGTLEVRSLLTIGTFTWSGGQIALPTLTSANGIYVVSTGALTPFGGTNTFNLTGASLTKGVVTPLLGATNMSTTNFSTTNFTVEGVGNYNLLIYSNTLWIDLLLDSAPAYPDFVIPGLTPNQTQVAQVMNVWVANNPVGDQATVLSALTNIPTSQWAAAYDQMSPRFYQQLSTIAFNLANAQNNELVQRMFGLRVAGTGFSMSGFADNIAVLEGQGDGSKNPKSDILRPGADTHWGMFVDGNGIFGSANSGNMLPNYNFQSGGITTGLTYQWSDTFLTGIYAGYQGAYAKNSGLGTVIDNSVRFGLISTYGTANGRGFYADGLLGGGYNNYQISRTIQFGSINRTANSSPGAGELDSMIAAGYNWKKGNWAFGPVGSLQYTYFGVNGFNETGAQSLNLANQGWNASSMISSLGANCAYSWQAKKDVMVVPQINLGWQHEFLQNAYAINSTMSGTPFANWSATPIRDTLYTGVGVTVEFAKKWNTSFFYNAAAGNSDLVSQNIFWSLGLRF